MATSGPSFNNTPQAGDAMKLLIGQPVGTDAASAASLGGIRPRQPESDQSLLVLWSGPRDDVSSTALNGADGHQYRIVDADDATRAGIEHRLRTSPPWLVVAGAHWCAELGAIELRRLRAAAAGVLWMLCWEAPSPDFIEALTGCGARGALRLGAGTEALVRAFDAVRAGEVWLPRCMTSWLLAALAPPPDPPLLADPHPLTRREAQVFDLLTKGLGNRQIAAQLGVSQNTVKKHVASVFEKRGLLRRRQVLGASPSADARR
ncbi:MAG: response regulator transcription factor [Burkholderiales bacterium]|jgi:DNA-binding NarL/FixJ family response regulator|nr:response regulator transcription factor [Burkholderiales bacterium]